MNSPLGYGPGNWKRGSEESLMSRKILYFDLVNDSYDTDMSVVCHFEPRPYANI